MKYRTLPGTAVRFRTLPRHDDVGRAEQRSRRRTRSSTTRSRRASTSSTPPRCIRSRRTPETQGRTEAILGNWLARQPRDRLRRSRRRSPDPAAATGSATAAPTSRATIIAEACDTSLARLRTDYIDLYQIHWPQRNVPMFGATEFDPAKEKRGPGDPRAGRGDGRADHRRARSATTACRTRRRGACASSGASRRSSACPGPVTVQNSYSLVSRSVDNDLAEALFREQMSLLAYSPLAGGMLTGKYRGGARPPNARHTLFDQRGPALPQAGRAGGHRRLRRRSRRARGLTLVQLALGYVRSRWYLGATIIGATTLAQLDEDIAAAQFELDARDARGRSRRPGALPQPGGVTRRAAARSAALAGYAARSRLAAAAFTRRAPSDASTSAAARWPVSTAPLR